MRNRADGAKHSESILEEITRLHIRPKHSFGQHFLIDEDVYSAIISSASLTRDQYVLEIGAGAGTLTTRLARHAGRVVTVESDESLVRRLPEQFRMYPNITLVPGDYLAIPHEELRNLFTGKAVSYKVVANLPYNITAHTLQKLVGEAPLPSECIVMVQQEVAERVTAKPGNMSMLGLTIQWRAEAEYLFPVDKSCFFPAPQVQSAVIRLRPRSKKLISLPEHVSEERMFSLAKNAFHHKRKTLANSLSGSLCISRELAIEHIRAIGHAEKARPQELSLQNWADLASRILKKK